MGRYAVALFIQWEDGETQSQRLYQVIVSANNDDEALGMVLHDKKRPFSDRPVFYYIVSLIED